MFTAKMPGTHYASLLLYNNIIQIEITFANGNQFLLLFLLWVCLPHFCSPEIMFRRTPVPQKRILGARVPRSDGKILHRQKRGWMWNQFFLLEEYTGSDYQYVGKVSLY